MTTQAPSQRPFTRVVLAPDINRAIRGILRYNLTEPSGVPRVEYLILLHWISEAYPMGEIDAVVRNGTAEAQRLLPENSVPRKLIRYLDPNYRPRNAECDPNIQFTTDCMVLRSLYCDVFPVPPQHLAIIRLKLRNGGYDTTHSLLALSEMERRGCGSQEVREAIHNSISVLVREMANFTPRNISEDYSEYDVFAEDAFVLMRAGAYEQIRPEWMATIEDHFKAKRRNIERLDPTVGLHETLMEALATVLWETRRGR